MVDRMTVYDAVFKACKEIEKVGEDGKHIVMVVISTSSIFT